MTWLAWRQLRLQAVAVLVAVVALSAVLGRTGPRLAELASTYPEVLDHVTPGDRNLFWVGLVVVALAPALIGVFWGAPMVARELEAGTHQLAWTQSVSRSRWLATRLGLTTLIGAVLVGATTFAVSWWSGPLDGAVSSSRGSLPSRLTPVAFAMRGIAPVGYTVLAVVVGTTLGAVLRRTLPAMAITLAVVAFAEIAAPLWVRPHLMPTSEQTLTFSRQRLSGITITDDGAGAPVRLTVDAGGVGNWVLSNQTVDAAGRATALPTWMNGCLPPPPPVGTSNGRAQQVPGPDRLDACLDRLNAEGYRQHLVYQPARNFWPLQWIETALFLVLSGLLAGLCFWWVRRVS